MRRTTRLFVLGALALAACGGDPDTSSNPDLGSAAADFAPAPADLATGSNPDLADDGKGVVVSDALAMKVIANYALQSKSAVIQELPVVGKSPSTSVALALIEIARDGQGLSITERGCHVSIEGGSLAMTLIPDAVPRSVPMAAASFRLWEENGQTLWRRPEVVTPVGVKLASPGDALPTAANDPRVWDQDQDGQPGVTVKVSGFVTGDIYIVQKQRTRYDGTVTAPFQFTGTMTDTSEQSVIGSPNQTLNMNIPQTPDPDPAKNTIKLVKLTTAYDCDKLVAEAPTLFK